MIEFILYCMLCKTNVQYIYVLILIILCFKGSTAPQQPLLARLDYTQISIRTDECARRVLPPAVAPRRKQWKV